MGLVFVLEKIVGFRSGKRIDGCFDPRIKNSSSVSVYIIAVHSVISVESLNSAYVQSHQLANKRFILFVPSSDCKNAALMPKFEASYMAEND